MMTRTALFAGRRPSAATPFRAASITMDPRRPAGPRRRPSARGRFGVEMMEERTLLSVTIPTYETVFPNPGSNPTVAVAPMQNTIAEGLLFNSAGYRDSVRVQLQAGELFTASVDVSATALYAGWIPWSLPEQDSSLGVIGPNGQNVASQSTNGQRNATDPVTGQPTNDSSVSFIAPVTGTYTLLFGTNINQLAITPTTPGWTIGRVNYYLTLRPIELHTGALNPDGNATDASLVSYSGGGMYAWLNSSHTQLTFSGPTGIGFQMGGNWTETTTPVSGNSAMSSINFSDTGNISVSLFGRTVTVPLPSGIAFTVQTAANGYNGAFGQVTGTSFRLTNQATESMLTDLISPFSALYSAANLSFPGGSTILPSFSVGVDLGGGAGPQSTNLPLNPAVPYIYLSASTVLGLQFGNVTANVGPYYTLGAAIDPTDTMLGLDVQGIPVLNEIGLEVSQTAMIPYTPAAPPNGFEGSLYGDLCFRGGLDLSAITADSLPLSLYGNFTINLDPTNQGLITTASQIFSRLLAGEFSPVGAFDYLTSLRWGLNGTLNLSLSLPGAISITIPTFQGSIVDDAKAAYIHANSVNPLANTPLQSLLNAGVAFDGDLGFDGSFSFLASATLTVGPATLAGSISISKSNGLVINGSVNSDSPGSLGSFASWDAYIHETLTIYVNASGAGFSLTGDMGASITFFPGSFAQFRLSDDIPTNVNQSVNWNQLGQEIDNTFNNTWNSVENWLNHII